jgi:hypothetical protein
MSDIPLNTYIEWTAEDRKRGKCPVPNGSDVTVWFSDGEIRREVLGPQGWEWLDISRHIIGYLVHELPRKPIVRWVVVNDALKGDRQNAFFERHTAEYWAKEYGGRVVKLVEVCDD